MAPDPPSNEIGHSSSKVERLVDAASSTYSSSNSLHLPRFLLPIPTNPNTPIYPVNISSISILPNPPEPPLSRRPQRHPRDKRPRQPNHHTHRQAPHLHAAIHTRHIRRQGCDRHKAMEPMYPAPSRVRHHDRGREAGKQAGGLWAGVGTVLAGGWETEGED